VALPGGDAQPRDHLLHEVANGQQHHQQPQQMETVLASCLHVGRNGAGIIVGFHDDQAGTEDHEEGQHVLLPAATDDDPPLTRGRGNIKFSLCHAHAPAPPFLLSAAEGRSTIAAACIWASTQTARQGALRSVVWSDTHKARVCGAR